MWTAGGVTLVPDASIAWRHEFADDRQSFTAAFLDDPSTLFNIISSETSPDSILVNAGLTAGVTKGLELFVDYNGVLNSDANSHNGSAGFRATW
jgi:outer membrane autotransporter protein